MTKIREPESVVPTLSGKDESLSLGADKIYISKITAPRLSSQSLDFLYKSRKLLANKSKKIFPDWVKEEYKHRVFTKLINLLTLTEKTKKTLIQYNFSETDIDKLNFRTCPSELENRLACIELEEKFGDLSDIMGLIRMESTAFRLNLSPHLENSGIIVPKRDKSTRRFYCLSVFRSIEDSRGFVLRSNAYQRRSNNEY